MRPPYVGHALGRLRTAEGVFFKARNDGVLMCAITNSSRVRNPLSVGSYSVIPVCHLTRAAKLYNILLNRHVLPARCYTLVSGKPLSAKGFLLLRVQKIVSESLSIRQAPFAGC